MENERESNYQVWGTSQNGEGFVQDLGKYEDVDEIRIHVGMFSPDMLITIERIWHRSEEDEE